MLPAASIAQQTFVAPAPALTSKSEPVAEATVSFHKVMAIAASSTKLNNCKDNSDPVCSVITRADSLLFLDQRRDAQLILKAENGNSFCWGHQLLHPSTSKERHTSI